VLTREKRRGKRAPAGPATGQPAGYGMLGETDVPSLKGEHIAIDELSLDCDQRFGAT